MENSSKIICNLFMIFQIFLFYRNKFKKIKIHLLKIVVYRWIYYKLLR